MLKKRLRLRSKEVEEVLKSGRSARSPHMQAKWVVSEESLRSAAVVAKSVVRKANVRNALRRSIYRAIASVSASSNTLPHAKAIFFLRVIPNERPSVVLKEEISFLLSKI
jgi:ribonuclease P protein component